MIFLCLSLPAKANQGNSKQSFFNTCFNVSLSWLVAVLSCNVYKCFSKYWSANATKPNRVNTRLCLYLTTMALFRLRTAFSLEDESSGPDRTGRDQTGLARTHSVQKVNRVGPRSDSGQQSGPGGSLPDRSGPDDSSSRLAFHSGHLTGVQVESF